jgi:hypothetical protein
MDLLKLLRLQWDRSLAIGAAAVGLLALILGYFGTSGTPHVAEQLPYFISGGLFGIFCLTIAAIAWISADLRDEWRELRGLRELLDEELRSRGGSGTARADVPGARSVTRDSLDAAVVHSEAAPAPARKPRARKAPAAAAAEQ